MFVLCRAHSLHGLLMFTQPFLWSKKIRVVKSSSSLPSSSSSTTTKSHQYFCRIFLVLLLGSFRSFPPKHGLQPVSAYNNNNNSNKSNFSGRIMSGAWKSQGRSQRDLVDQLVKRRIIESDAVRRVMETVDRGNYCDSSDANKSGGTGTGTSCYTDGPLSIGLGQTISAPHMHAYALEEIYPTLAAQQQQQRDLKILDVGCGSGYLTACFGRWLSAKPGDNDNNEKSILGLPLNNNSNSKVFGIDVHEGLVDTTRRNIRRADGDLLETGTVNLSVRDGWKGLPEHAPFDAIHVGAAAETLPRALATQLKVGGVMVIPIGSQNWNQAQVLYKIRRIGGGNNEEHQNTRVDRSCSSALFREEDFEITSLLGVRYVPLVRGEQG